MDDGCNGIAAGGRAVGAEKDRLPAARDLQGSGDDALRLELVVPQPRKRLAFEPDADAVRRRAHPPRRTLETGDVDPVGARAGNGAQDDLVRQRVGTGLRDLADIAPDAQNVARANRARAEPGEQIGRTAAEHLRDVDPAAHRDVRARAALVAAELELLPGCRVPRVPHDRTGDCDECRLAEAEPRAG